jgi:hypothetical protein
MQRVCQWLLKHEGSSSSQKKERECIFSWYLGFGTDIQVGADIANLKAVGCTFESCSVSGRVVIENWHRYLR